MSAAQHLLQSMGDFMKIFFTCVYLFLMTFVGQEAVSSENFLMGLFGVEESKSIPLSSSGQDALAVLHALRGDSTEAGAGLELGTTQFGCGQTGTDVYCSLIIKDMAAGPDVFVEEKNIVGIAGPSSIVFSGNFAEALYDK